MKSLITLFLSLNIFTFSQIIHAACVQERTVYGHEFSNLEEEWIVHVETTSGFQSSHYIDTDPLSLYQVQLTPKSHIHKELGIESSFLPYYDSQKLEVYLGQIQLSLGSIKYQLNKIGESLEGKPLYAIFPKQIDKNKTTIIMFGRQHGDEGTQNYIIEGFLDQLLLLSHMEWHSHYQVILYPMINPDGADARTRYNANGRDLNREWADLSLSEKDEAKIVHDHLRNIIQYESLKISHLLDMHGSFTEDFIYRVAQNFISRDFFQMQQAYIDKLAALDSWQAGNFKVSNGNRRMARIVFNKKGLNALTHETPRNIALNNRRGRSIQTLKDQGVAIFKTFPLPQLPLLRKIKQTTEVRL